MFVSHDWLGNSQSVNGLFLHW